MTALHGKPVVGDLPDLLRPILLTEADEAALRSLLAHVQMLESPQAAEAARLLEAIESREVDGPNYSYVLAGPWGTIREGDGSLEATIAGCRDARRQHWAQGHGRDDRYHQIQVERYATYYVSDADGDDLGDFSGTGIVVPVEDDPLTAGQQAESDARIAAGQRRHEALYAHLRDTQKTARERAAAAGE